MTLYDQKMGAMDIYLSQLEYIRSMMDRTSGLKVLILDSETTGMISLIYSQTQILEKEVFLIELIDSPNREPVRHLKAIFFVRPTHSNFLKINEELKHPLYSEYHLYFTNIVPSTELEELARNDEFELVQEVHEVFADIYALNNNLFSLNLENIAPMIYDPLSWSSDHWAIYNRMIDGLFALLCSLRIKPTIRFLRTSPICSRIAKQLSARITEEVKLFEGNASISYSIHSVNNIEDVYPTKGQKDTVLLILDRRDDPITPLLNQWTYQAMLHELIGIKNNRLTIPETNESPKQIMMSPFSDSFYKDHYTANFGQLGISIKQLLEEYQKHKPQTSKLESVEDILKFLEMFPDYQKMSGNVSKHVDTMHLLSKLVSKQNLIEISQIEQELACHNNIQEHFNMVMDKFNSPQGTPQFELLRLALLYCLRYEGDPSVSRIKKNMNQKGFDNSQVQLLDNLLEYAGSANRSSDLFKSKNFLDMAKTTIQRTLQGTSNVLTQHQPLVATLIDSLYKGKLKEANFPIINPLNTQGSSKEKPSNIIIFIIGGATYEEAKTASEFSANNNCQVILGGTTILNTKSFISDFGQISKRYRTDNPY